MKATEVIKRDHRAAEDLFSKFKKAEESERDQMAEDIFRALETHEAMEDRYFYPALEDKMEDNAVLDQLEDEQKQLERDVKRIKKLTRSRNEQLEVAMDKILAHAKKEEKEIFTKAEKVLTDQELEDLGDKMEPMSAVGSSEERIAVFGDEE